MPEEGYVFQGAVFTVRMLKNENFQLLADKYAMLEPTPDQCPGAARTMEESMGRFHDGLRRAIALLLLLAASLSAAWAAPVQISLEREGRPVRLNADWEVPAGVDPQARGAILWLHGALQTYAMQDPVRTQSKKWVKAGFPVLAITLSNGVSNRTAPLDCSQPIDTTLRDAMQELGAWEQWLRRRGINKIVLAGHSRGGQQVILFAAWHPSPAIRGVLAVAPAPDRPGPGPQLTKAEKLVAVGKGKTLLKSDFLICRDARVSARTLASYEAKTPDQKIRDLLPKIRVPVLVVAGGQDEIVKDLPARLRGVAGTGRIQVRVIDTADHFFRDFAADDLGDMATAFFKKCLR